MKYFVTGATGFIGSYVARQLVQAGHDVIALVRTPTKAGKLTALGVKTCQGDITDKASMREPMTGVDGVFHIAGWYEIGIRDKARMEAINVGGTRNVLELVRELDIPKAVYTSTVAIFSDTGGRLVDETYRHEGSFISTYERSKWLAYHEVAVPMMRDGLPLVAVLPGVTYGPGDKSLVREVMVQYLRGRLFYAPQRTAFSWTYVEDTARGHLLAMERGRVGESYLLAGEELTLIEAFELGADLLGIPAPRLKLHPAVLKTAAAFMSLVERAIPITGRYAAETLRTVAGVTYFGSSEKAKRELGYTARPLREGLYATAVYELGKLGVTLPDEPPITAKPQSVE